MNDAGSVERIFAPSPRFRPVSVSVKGFPCCAPRGCRSVITGWAERLDADPTNTMAIKSDTRLPWQPHAP